MKKIAILGCGWLGLPLAKKLIESGYTINGSTTRPEKIKTLRDNGIQPFLIKLSDSSFKGAFSIYHPHGGKSIYLSGTWSNPEKTRVFPIEFTVVKLNDR